MRGWDKGGQRKRGRGSEGKITRTVVYEDRSSESKDSEDRNSESKDRSMGRKGCEDKGGMTFGIKARFEVSKSIILTYT